MSTLYRLKAYFGMVPAEDMDAYLDYDDEHEYYPDDDRRRPRYHQQSAADYPPERNAQRVDRHPAERHYHERSSGDRHYPDRQLDRPLVEPVRSVSAGGSGRGALVHGSLAVEPSVAEPPRRPVPLTTASESAVEAASAKPLPMSRITTVHPRSYDEARTIGERYRDGIPVIINLTELDDSAAKRLVDFAAGLAFALRGSIDKITSRVFLLSPAGVDVSAEDRRKLAERGFFGQS